MHIDILLCRNIISFPTFINCVNSVQACPNREKKSSKEGFILLRRIRFAASPIYFLRTEYHFDGAKVRKKFGFEP